MSNKMALPDLGKLDELAKVHAASYASPHHFTMSVNGLREVVAALQLPAGNKMALDALTKILKIFERDAFDIWLEAKSPSGDVEQVQRQWESSSEYSEFCDKWADARAAIAALQAEPQPAIPDGWGLSSADFSLQASGVSEFGGVMLIRTGADRADWHALTDEQRDVIPLYVSGTGRTVTEAIASAAKNCTPLPSTPPKD